jgi:MFS family permease
VAVICALFGSAAMLWLAGAQDLWMLYAFAIVYGLALGGFGSSFTPLLGDIFGLTRIGSILGVLGVGWAIGSASGPLVGGIVFDVGNSYSPAFLIGAAALGMMVLLTASIQQETKRSS